MSRHPLAEMLHLTQSEASMIALALGEMRLRMHKSLCNMRDWKGDVDPETGNVARRVEDDLTHLEILSGKVATILEYYELEQGRQYHAPDQIHHNG